jgi:hypothetical protein
MTQETNLELEAALANLSPEEREALNESALTEEEIEALKTVAGDEDDGDDEDEDEDEDDDPGAAAEKAEPEPASVEGDTFRPRYQATLPEDFAAQKQAVDDREAELIAQFKAGEIDAEAFVAESLLVVNKRQSLDVLRTKEEIAKEMAEQSAVQEWQWSVNSFINKVKRDEGIDYGVDAAKAQDFDNFVKVLAASPENADKSHNWFLSEAHKRTKVLHGISEKAAETPTPKTAPSRKPPTDSLPATLAHVPGGDGPGDVSGDGYENIDKLEGLEYERALASMPKAQREQYLSAA